MACEGRLAGFHAGSVTAGCALTAAASASKLSRGCPGPPDRRCLPEAGELWQEPPAGCRPLVTRTWPHAQTARGLCPAPAGKAVTGAVGTTQPGRGPPRQGGPCGCGHLQPCACSRVCPELGGPTTPSQPLPHRRSPTVPQSDTGRWPRFLGPLWGCVTPGSEWVPCGLLSPLRDKQSSAGVQASKAGGCGDLCPPLRLRARASERLSRVLGPRGWRLLSARPTLHCPFPVAWHNYF